MLSFQCIRRHRSLGRAPGGAGRGLRSQDPCGVPTGTAPMGLWSSSTAACVVGATGYRGGLLARQAACHFGGMHGAVAIFLAKHGYVIISFTISNNMESGFSQTHQRSSAYGGIGLLGAPLGARDEAFGHKIPVVRPQGYDTEHRHVRTQKNNVF